MRHRTRTDAGQAFPIYVVMVAGLLFLAFVFFAVGKAAALRNGAQGAADAAALAAAQQTREQFKGPFLASLPGKMLDPFLQAHPVMGCPAAYGLASANRARVTNCQPIPGGLRDRIRVEVKGRDAVDSPVVPNTKRTFATTEATAVIEFRCPDWESADFNDDGVQDMYFFTCRGGQMLQIAPGSPPPWSQVSKILYDVHLVDN
ncbi:pilus assembly protein TadG-related protein [Streptomyces sp. Ncost-T10-10d]|uniref:pilus assembly protein TadG-related protein n=1 Tax=Streptomyces sp. Ncost-T10-10d TaxID=1839774 RepID=UPI00081F1058|nr:pilus assembly protein TadG-related protein [Streptomyces sp. Ncost-T10-10d]SCF78269.1 Flp pilus assembly protein TadG [Streptomyces sp. Ncost-T10-10d]